MLRKKGFLCYNELPEQKKGTIILNGSSEK
jgi:hypothetical protein